MSKKIGFIGCGNMGRAMVSGMIASGKCKAADIIASAKSEKTRAALADSYGIEVAEKNITVAEKADILFLAVKPYMYEAVIGEIRAALRQDQIIVSIAPGKSLEWLTGQVGCDAKIIRTMPNTPSMVGEGMMGICATALVSAEEMEEFRSLCSGFSRSEIVAEHLMDVVTALSGSSPAYVFMFIEAMADAGVAGGMPRAQAYEFAAQAVLGSAKMVLETGMHPGALKDMVCSPAGTTIQAVRVLEEKGMRSAVFEATTRCLEMCRRV